MDSTESLNLILKQARISHIPDSWQLKRVGEAMIIRNSLRKPISENDRKSMSGRYPYYGPTKIQDWINEYRLDGNYVLIGEDGDHFFKYKELPMTQLVTGKCNVNNHAHVLEGTALCSTEWFYYYFKHRDISNFLTRQGAGRYKLNKATLARIPLIIPPRAEQEKITRILASWEYAIGLVEKLIANSKSQKNALLQQFLAEKAASNGVAGNIRNEIPLNAVCSIITKGTTPPATELSTENSGINFIKVESMPSNGTFNREKFAFISKEAHETLKRSRLSAGDILFSIAGAIGRAAIVTRDILPANTNQAIAIIRLKDEAPLSRDFLYYFLTSNHFKRHLNRITSKAAQPNLTLRDIGDFRIKAPPMEMQEKISSILKATDELILNYERQLATLTGQRQSLMQQLLTGKRRVRVTRKEGSEH